MPSSFHTVWRRTGRLTAPVSASVEALRKVGLAQNGVR
jgi:hypothetical protein